MRLPRNQEQGNRGGLLSASWGAPAGRGGGTSSSPGPQAYLPGDRQICLGPGRWPEGIRTQAYLPGDRQTCLGPGRWPEGILSTKGPGLYFLSLRRMHRCEARMCVSRETIVEPEEILQKLSLDRGQQHPDLGSLCRPPGRLGPTLLGPLCSSLPTPTPTPTPLPPTSRPVRWAPAFLP